MVRGGKRTCVASVNIYVTCGKFQFTKYPFFAMLKKTILERNFYMRIYLTDLQRLGASFIKEDVLKTSLFFTDSKGTLVYQGTLYPATIRGYRTGNARVLSVLSPLSFSLLLQESPHKHWIYRTLLQYACWVVLFILLLLTILSVLFAPSYTLFLVFVECFIVTVYCLVSCL